MKGNKLNSSPSVLQVIQTIGIIMIALGIFFLSFILLGYKPEDRVGALVTATQQMADEIVTVVTLEPPIEIVDGIVLDKDSACNLIDISIQGTYYDEYPMGYFVAGDVVQKTGNISGSFVEVIFNSETNLKINGTCWIKE